MAYLPRVLLLLLLTALLTRDTSAVLPPGFSTFFASARCPDGWFDEPSSAGRLIVSVADGAESGVTVNRPLKDQEDREHQHPYSLSLNLPVKHIAAIDCCDSHGACAGSYPLAGFTSNHTSGLPFTQLILCTVNHTHPNNAHLFAPFSAVAYFPGSLSCPAHWQPLPEAQGRVLLPGTDRIGLLQSPHAPLASGQLPTHVHDFVATLNVSTQSYAGVDGCCNDELGEAGSYRLPSVASVASSNLPYIQLLTCINQNQTFDSALPVDTYLFSESGCAPGWNTSLELLGRFPVANPTLGLPGAAFGGSSLSPLETSAVNHTHLVSGTIELPDCEVGLISGCCSSGYAVTGPVHFLSTSAPAPVDIPFVWLPLCSQTTPTGSPP
eukprot:CAMPEP_0174238548 /NCGR_PEP_ID=MMETSP0417-20130205/11647_1 /TAXON_ID=242541 /ORGANISM="Mayorella sp, Strain BSH-02190019" /LENGTH=380 /DNA_ID=CAMNT_0015317393 /DNA_START=81 /DNA_END=1219 /DNA_ORIENTATION=-